jgi:hypothetical protein
MNTPRKAHDVLAFFIYSEAVHSMIRYRRTEHTACLAIVMRIENLSGFQNNTTIVMHSQRSLFCRHCPDFVFPLKSTAQVIHIFAPETLNDLLAAENLTLREFS